MSSSVAPDDRGASHPRSGILTPTSDGSLNYATNSAAASPAARAKRRRSDPAMDRLLKPSIAVKPHPHALHIQPKTLSPLFLLRRQHLSIGCIDFQSTTAETTYSRFVESRIKILDLESRLGSMRSVLVARHDATRTVYALEREEEGLYTMCKLGAWANLERLAQHASAVCQDRVFGVKAEPQQQHAPLAELTPHMNNQQRQKRAAIEAIQSLVRKKPKAEPGLFSDETAALVADASTQGQVWDAMLEPTSDIMTPHVKESEEEPPVPEIMIRHPKVDPGEEPKPGTMIPCVKPAPEDAPMPEIMIRHPKIHPGEEPMPKTIVPCLNSAGIETKAETSAEGANLTITSSQIHSKALDDGPQDMATNIFQNVRLQYFEALYKSMGSLAYFAKGPLSRARSTFHLDLEASLDMADLIDFLKSLILTTVQIDKKYRETAPEIISQLSTYADSSDDARSKGRKAKKMKIGKNCLYPAEDDRIRRWWNANKPELDEEQPTFSATQVKSHLSLLRTRETQLQMIIVLEILALEPLKTADDGADSSLPALPGASSAVQAQRSPAVVQTKKRNKHNLPVLLDVHADRLTIWQSTATDEQQLAEDSQVNRQSLNGQRVQKSSSEPLKDFCTDVIVPFFSARIPELCDSINRKLGGPVILPASGSKSQKRSASKREQKPGSATKRPAAPRPPKTLQRALSTDQLNRRSVSRGPSNMIALMRSATSTTVPIVKREGSEPAKLRRVSTNDIESQRRPALSRSSSVVGQDGNKASKKALVDAQVRDAIAALRKPNREVVGQAMEEADSQRALAAKKARKTQRAHGSSIQVQATPANNRFRDVFAQGDANPDTPMQYVDDVIPPSSIGPFIPSTGHRTRNPMSLNTSPAIDRVGNTPTKRMKAPSFFIRRPDDEPCVPPSPLARTARPLTSDTRVENRLQLPNVPEESERKPDHKDNVFATPAKKQQQMLSASPVGQLQLKQQDQNKPQKSIYDRLGWDDDYDI